jgi:hypothetical protein
MHQRAPVDIATSFSLKYRILIISTLSENLQSCISKGMSDESIPIKIIHRMAHLRCLWPATANINDKDY